MCTEASPPTPRAVAVEERHTGAIIDCAIVSVMPLDEELDRILAGRDRDNMQPTIEALLPLYPSHPENARVPHAVGGTYDTAGQEGY